MRKSKAKECRRGRGGFTLVELLLVVTILGILAAVVVVNFQGQGEEARRQATRASLSAIATAVSTYEIMVGRYPDSMDDLTAPINERRPLLQRGQLNDAWGSPFRYKLTARDDYELRSAGPDAKMDTEDDLTSK